MELLDRIRRIGRRGLLEIVSLWVVSEVLKAHF